MNKNSSKTPWNVAFHKPFSDSDFVFVKVENKDGVVFDGFHDRINDAILAANAPNMLEALAKIADPWKIREELLIKDDVTVLFEMAAIARTIVDKIANEQAENSN